MNLQYLVNLFDSRFALVGVANFGFVVRLIVTVV
jgi:hypothetical protein